MPSLLSPADVSAIKRLRRAGFATARAVADPKTDLVLDRDGTELDAQAVLVDWVSRRSTRQVGGTQAMTEAQADVVFRRPAALGFDVARGDRFRLQENTGVVTRVFEDAGYVFAEATLDVGRV